MRPRTSTGCSSSSRSCWRPRRTDIFLVGDDDQSIYGWRLADVRRILGLEALLPGLRRVDLEVNYRCPRPVVERAVRLVEHNDERFAKTIRAGPVASGRLILAAGRRRRDDPARTGRPIVARRRHDAGDPRPDQPGAAPRGRRRAPARAAVPGAADRAAARLADRRPAPGTRWRRWPIETPLLVALGRVRATGATGDGAGTRRGRARSTEVAIALGWAVGLTDLAGLVAAIERDPRSAGRAAS